MDKDMEAWEKRFKGDERMNGWEYANPEHAPLPETGTIVLAYHEDWGVHEGYVDNGEVVGNWAGIQRATHWKPMPKGPYVSPAPSPLPRMEASRWTTNV